MCEKQNCPRRGILGLQWRRQKFKLMVGSNTFLKLVENTIFNVILKSYVDTRNDVKFMATQTLESLCSFIWWQPYWRAIKCPPAILKPMILSSTHSGL